VKLCINCGKEQALPVCDDCRSTIEHPYSYELEEEKEEKRKSFLESAAYMALCNGIEV
jgi:hypothetical protein